MQRHPVAVGGGVADAPQHHLTAVRQPQPTGALQRLQIQPLQHGPDSLRPEGLSQIVAGSHLIALAGEVVAGGGEGQPHLSVSGPQPPGHLHACGAAHVDIQHHQLEGAGLPVRQQRFPAAVVGDLRLPTQLLGEILLQLRQSPGIIIHQSDLHRQCSSLHDTVSIILRTGRKNKKNDMPRPKLKIFLKPSRFLHWDVV